jgi:hypothetical protein
VACHGVAVHVMALVGSSRRDSRGMCFAEKHDLETDPAVGQVVSTQLQAGRPKKQFTNSFRKLSKVCI